jgi:hypothetical protein
LVENVWLKVLPWLSNPEFHVIGEELLVLEWVELPIQVHRTVSPTLMLTTLLLKKLSPTETPTVAPSTLETVIARTIPAKRTSAGRRHLNASFKFILCAGNAAQATPDTSI